MVDRQHRPGAKTGSGGVMDYSVYIFELMIFNRMLISSVEKDLEN
jgi:hypothetical protein